MRPRSAIIIGALSLLLAACQATSSSTQAEHSTRQTRRVQQTPDGHLPLAYLAGNPIETADMLQSLIEAQGGVVLAELVLDRMVAQRLDDDGLTLTDAQIQAERAVILEPLADDPDQALRLLGELRQRRGWGEQRFASLLRRNAGLRTLIQPQVEVSAAAIDQMYELVYGPRYEVRLIVVNELNLATQIVQQARSGDSFIALATRHSTDESRAQGGLLDPISPADATYPAAIRTALRNLEPQAISAPIALEQGYAIVKLERKIEGRTVPFDDVKEELTHQTKRRLERVLMQQLAREMIQSADLLVFDPALAKVWNQQKRLMLEGQ